jgi:hypothetical protein
MRCLIQTTVSIINVYEIIRGPEQQSIHTVNYPKTVSENGVKTIESVDLDTAASHLSGGGAERNDEITFSKIPTGVDESSILHNNTQSIWTNAKGSRSYSNTSDDADSSLYQTPPPATRKRPFKDNFNESEPIEKCLRPLAQSPTRHTIVAESEVLHSNIDLEGGEPAAKMTRAKKVKLKMGGTSFRTVDKFWASPLSSSNKTDLNDKD